MNSSNIWTQTKPLAQLFDMKRAIVCKERKL